MEITEVDAQAIMTSDHTLPPAFPEKSSQVAADVPDVEREASAALKTPCRDFSCLRMRNVTAADCEDKRDAGAVLIASLRENSSKAPGLIEKLRGQSNASFMSVGTSVKKAREKFLERQKAYIQKLAEKRRTEEEQAEMEYRKKHASRERLRSQVLLVRSPVSDENVPIESMDTTNPPALVSIGPEKTSNEADENLGHGSLCRPGALNSSEGLDSSNAEKPETSEKTVDSKDGMDQSRECSSLTASPSGAQENKAGICRTKSYMNKTEAMELAEKWSVRTSPYLGRMEPISRTKEDRSRMLAKWKEEFRVWREHRGLSEDTKVFIIVGGYSDVRRALKARGWVENKDPQSDFYHLKWTLKPKHIEETRMVEPQIANHYKNSFQYLTTKVGLLKSLKALPWYFDVDMGTFFPRCYNLSDASDYHAFDVDFKRCAARSILKSVIKSKEFNPNGVPNYETLEAALAICKAHLTYCRDLVEEDVHDGNAPQLPDSLNENQWKLVLECPIFHFGKRGRESTRNRRYRRERRRTGRKRKNPTKTCSPRIKPGADQICPHCCNKSKLRQTVETDSGTTAGNVGLPDPKEDCQSEAESEYSDRSSSSADTNSDSDSSTELKLENAELTRCNARRASAQQAADPVLSERESVTQPQSATICQGDASKGESVPGWLLKQSEDLLASLGRWNTQNDLDGTGNIWILKPGGKSRGRGVACFNSLEGIREGARVECASDGCAQQWVVQKYIENPLIIDNRKFDIRQWVVVTSWDPLTVWFYDDCYVRFCAEDFSLSDIANIFCHLSNNCVGRRSKKFHTNSIGTGNMWSSQTFADHLQKRHGPNVWENTIQPRMKDCVIKSLAGAQESVQRRKNSHELFGYDFMVDEDLRVWLLEINCSPSFEHSTPITTPLVKQMVADLLKVIVDLPEHMKWRRLRSSTSSPVRGGEDGEEVIGEGSSGCGDALHRGVEGMVTQEMKAYLKLAEGCDTGKWGVIYRADPCGSCGGPKILSNPLVLKGNLCKIHRYRAAGIKTFSADGNMPSTRLKTSVSAKVPPKTHPRMQAAPGLKLRSLKKSFLVVKPEKQGAGSSNSKDKSEGPSRKSGSRAHAQGGVASEDVPRRLEEKDREGMKANNNGEQSHPRNGQASKPTGKQDTPNTCSGVGGARDPATGTTEDSETGLVPSTTRLSTLHKQAIQQALSRGSPYIRELSFSGRKRSKTEDGQKREGEDIRVPTRRQLAALTTSPNAVARLAAALATASSEDHEAVSSTLGLELSSDKNDWDVARRPLRPHGGAVRIPPPRILRQEAAKSSVVFGTRDALADTPESTANAVRSERCLRKTSSAPLSIQSTRSLAIVSAVDEEEESGSTGLRACSSATGETEGRMANDVPGPNPKTVSLQMDYVGETRRRLNSFPTRGILCAHLIHPKDLLKDGLSIAQKRNRMSRRAWSHRSPDKAVAEKC